MLASMLHVKLATATMASWVSAASPLPMPVTAVLAVEQNVASPVEVELFDHNRRISATVEIERDGTTDPATKAKLAHMFRDLRSDREKPIAQRTLAMLADLAEKYGKPIEFVSAYRTGPNDGPSSPHRAGRAIDLRVRGVDPREVRDYLWSTFQGVGIGWYPGDNFVHMDSRPEPDIAWTFTNGTNHYHPHWANVARSGVPKRERRPGS